MNHSRHLVAWYGAIGMGGVIHTINPRLFDEQLVYIANHAEDRVLLYDAAFQPIVDRLKPQWTTIEHYICFDGDGARRASRRWIGAEDGDYAWVEGDEREPCMLCYTSGTTGNPKGVLYEHRSTMLHAMAEVAARRVRPVDAVGDAADRADVPRGRLGPAVRGAAGRRASSSFRRSTIRKMLCELMNREKVTHSAGVPTVWLGDVPAYRCDRRRARATCKVVTIGGSAAPRAMIERLMKHGRRASITPGA